ncbi:MAG: hypothetical protein NTV46_02565 [Verrucomicrobia bacterium]|nr:hypothetical protein [Verrucomicrobiota bacterium]
MILIILPGLFLLGEI